ncbi:TetR/AcrR family transcriptional regulator [Virgibacillus kimchii]
MNDKQMRLIQAGIKLFADKGYYHTSIQEIATEAGVSKGSFYLYFQSKEEFIAKAYRYFYNIVTEKLERVKNEKLPPREILAKQITILMELMYNYKDFFRMHIRENITIGEDINRLIHEIKEYNFNWMKEMILSIYGESQRKLLLDTVIQFDGLLNAYFKWMVFNDLKVDKTRAGTFIISRLDDVVDGMNHKAEQPLAGGLIREVENPIAKLQYKLNQLMISDKKRKQLQEVIAVLEEETRKKTHNPVIIQGLLAHFAPIEEVKEECSQLAETWNVELSPSWEGKNETSS